MIAVVLTFVPATVFLKLVSIGMAAAIFVDAALASMVFVPTSMELLGDRNWWLPRWLDRVLLPNVHVDGSDQPRRGTPTAPLTPAAEPVDEPQLVA